MSLPLLHSPSDVLRRLLIALGLGSDPAPWANGSGDPWPIFATAEPPVPDSVITVYDTTPKEDGRAMTTGETWLHHGVQVRVRSGDPVKGYARAAAVHTALDEKVYQNALTLDSAQYVVHAVSGTMVLSIGQDTPTSKRSLFTVNALVALRRTA